MDTCTNLRTNGRVLMLPTYLDDRGDLNTASARIRAYWVAQAWDGCDFYDGSQDIPEYDVLIFQKLYLTREWRIVAARARDRGQRVVFDLCDPVWEQGAKGPLLDMLSVCNMAVASTDPIRDWLARWLPAVTIGDYIDLATHTNSYMIRRVDANLDACWVGYSANFSAVNEFYPYLLDRGIRLTVISDKPHRRPEVRFLPWSQATVNTQMAMLHDLVINPVGSASRWKYKSNNKTRKAWALGCPVARTVQELDYLMSWKNRKAEHHRVSALRESLGMENAVRLWKRAIATEGQ